MTEPVQRPKRPAVLITAVVLLTFATVFFSMTATRLGALANQNTGLHTIAWVFCLLALRFNWARITSVVLLALLTLQWLPGAIRYAGDESVSQPAAYVLIGTALFVLGVVLVFHTAANQYYREAKQSRRDRKRQDLQT